MDPADLAVGPAPQLPFSVYARRRRELARRLGPGHALVVATHPPQRYANDVEYPFRPHSDFWYLTGFDEPRAVLVLHGGSGATDLFVQPRRKEAEIWTGRRLGAERAPAALGIDRAHSSEELASKLPGVLGRSKVHAVVDHDPLVRRRLARAAGSRLLPVPEPVKVGGPDSALLKRGRRRPTTHGRTMLHEMRLVKDADEMRMLRKACDLGVEAHRAAAPLVRPGTREYQVEAAFAHHARHRGSTGVGYPSICGCGPNSAVLHYVRNQGTLRPGQTFLVDAGCEWGFYTSDITRTYPVGGFTPLQSDLYDLVHSAHRAALREVRPGKPFRSPHAKAVDVLTAGLIDLGLLDGPFERAMKEQSYRSYFMHGTSHFLGLDVHDAGGYTEADGSPRILREGMVLTVEPGLYFNPDFAPACPRRAVGIGIRIEDDVAVTAGGRTVLTRALPTEQAAVADLQG